MSTISKELIDILYQNNRDNIINLINNSSKNKMSKIIDFLNDKYYNEVGIIDDIIYDEIVEIYEQKYEKYKKIGYEPLNKKKEKLPFYLGSLNKIKENKELEKWKNKYNGPYILEDKIDGLSLLIYTYIKDNRRITKLFTRGNGNIGTDVSHLLNYVQFPEWIYPQFIQLNSNNIKIIGIRGEIIINKKIYNKVKKIREIKNARNYVAGIINSKTNFNQDDASNLSFYAYHLIIPDIHISYPQQLLYLQKWGFLTPNPYNIDNIDLKTLTDYHNKRKIESEYDIDGVVIYSNDDLSYPNDGNPKHVVAFKVIGEDKITTVLDVIWEASRTYKLKPIVIYEPINISGAILQRATAYNARFIISNNIGPGAIIRITRSGEVIPKVIEVLQGSPNGPKMPNISLGNYYWNDSHVELLLESSNKDVITNKLIHFLDRLDIKTNIGPKRIRILVDNNILSINDLLNLTPSFLENLPSFGHNISTDFINLLHSKTKNVKLSKLMDASGIFENIGYRRFDTILQHFPYLLSMTPSSISSNLKNIKGFNILADKISINIPIFLNWLSDHSRITYFIPDTSLHSTLSNEIIVFSGFRDKNLESYINKLGGKVNTSVSSKTTLLLIKNLQSTNSKYNQAITLNIKIMLKDDFTNIISK